jgi:hypothetical protein
MNDYFSSDVPSVAEVLSGRGYHSECTYIYIEPFLDLFEVQQIER